MKYTRMLMYCRKGRAAASVPDLKDYGFGENGTQAWNKVQENEAVRNNRRLRAGFTAMYQAGMRGESASAVKSDAAKYIPPSVQTAAYQAGLADAAESLEREKAAVQFVSSAGSESGLVDNEYSRKLAEEKSGTAALLSMLGKDLGVRVEIVPKVLGGSANGQYVASRNLVQIAADADNAFEFVAAHEVTHRMQSLAPEEYRSYRDYAIRFRAQELGEEGAGALVERYRMRGEDAGVNLTQEEAMDEIAADFTMRMIEDGGLFEDFAKENRSEAKKLLDALKAFVQKVKSLFRSKEARDKAAREAYGKDMATLEECVARWQKAYTAAGKAAQNAKTAAGEGSGAGRLMLKGFSENAVSVALHDALSEKATRQNNLIPVSVMPRYISEKLEISGDFYIQRDHAYENMVSKDQAIRDGRPTQRKGEAIHFHNLGVEKMTRAIMSINEPTMTIATKTKDGNPAVIMMLPEYGNNDAPLYAVLSFYSSKSLNGDFSVRPHVVLTIAERNFFEDGGRYGWADVVERAISEGTVIDFNKKERQNLSEIAQPVGLGNITDASLKKNLAQFKKDVKRFRETNHIQYSLKGMDSAYLAAVERGDTEAAQKMVDDAAKAAGYTYRRNTRRKLSAKNGTATHFMFVDDPDAELRIYGENRYAATGDGAINLNEDDTEIKKLADAFYGEDVDNDLINPPDIVDSAGVWDDFDFVQYAWDNYFEGIYLATDKIPAVIAGNGLVVFGDDYERVKSLDAVTYDDNNNVVPISERFNSGKTDIRFQLKSVTELEQEVKELKKYAAYRKRGTSDREILASTADGSAQTEWERKRLSEYKDVMSRLETYERRLAENKAKLAKD